MRLWTYQGYDLQSFKGPILLDRGLHGSCKAIGQAKKLLYERISEDQVVWCSQSYPDTQHLSGMYIHRIDYDSRDIVAIIDALVWCHIIGYEPRYIPLEEHKILRSQAIGDGVDFDEALRKREDNYLSANLPSDLWTAVIKQSVCKESDQLLLRFPFSYSIVSAVNQVS